LNLLTTPILPTLLRLAAPNMLAMVMTVLVGIAETFSAGMLGIAPLAAMALVFPFAMLTNMLSAGAMGGGVSSSLARALGAQDAVRAQAVVLHAMVIGAGMGAGYSLLLALSAPSLLAWLGGEGAVLREAVAYAQVLFPGAILVWLFNTMVSVVRGMGNMRVSSRVVMATALLQVLLGSTLALGLMGLPRLGIRGLALGQLMAVLVGVLALAWYLRSGRAALTLRWHGITLQGRLFGDILRVGAMACLSPLQSVATMLLLAGFVARLGTLPLAGYAIGQRLEFLLSTVAFAVGLASVPMVGMAVGAGLIERARRVAWTAGAVSAVNLGVVGLLVAWQPDLWATLFTQDEAVLAYCRQHLQWTGPVFAFFGLGVTLYFASQGAGRLQGAVAAATLRLLWVAAGGAWLMAQGAPAWQLFALGAAGMVLYGGASVAALHWTPWVRR
jgi:putative MATE family efflux protein